MMTFENHIEVAEAVALEIITRLPARPELEIKKDSSNVSLSTYINVTIWALDDDGDREEAVDEYKLRISDHADRHGSNYTVRIEGHLIDQEDELGYCGSTMEAWAFDALVQEGLSKILSAVGE